MNKVDIVITVGNRELRKYNPSIITVEKRDLERYAEIVKTRIEQSIRPNQRNMYANIFVARKTNAQLRAKITLLKDMIFAERSKE